VCPWQAESNRVSKRGRLGTGQGPASAGSGVGLGARPVSSRQRRLEQGSVLKRTEMAGRRRVAGRG